MKPSPRVFVLIWFGQLVSLIGSELTTFAMGVWVYQSTGSALQFTMIAVCSLVPEVVFAPFAGVLVDRWDRRKAMILGDSGAAFSTLTIALLIIAGELHVWHIYLVAAVSSAMHAIQWPAYLAATTLLLPKRHLGRAAGMRDGAAAAARILAPVLGAVLIATIHLHGVILIDFATFLFAVTALAVVRIPKPEQTAEGAVAKGSMLREAASGWRYITERPGLRWMLGFVTTNNLVTAIAGALIVPVVLSSASPTTLGTVLSSGGLGYLTGSVVMAVWGGPKRLVYGVIGGYILRGLCYAAVGLPISGALMAVAYGVSQFCFPILAGCSQAIWQKKVVADMQGRVFAVRRAVANSSVAVARVLAGILAEYLFVPLLVVGGPLASSIGPIVGVGPGRGIGLLCIVMGTLAALHGAMSLWVPRLVRVEEELPDVIPEGPSDAAVVR